MSVFVSLNCNEIRQSVPSAIPLSKGSFFDDGPRDCLSGFQNLPYPNLNMRGSKGGVGSGPPWKITN